MTYREELQDYINKESGLVGVTPNKANYSSGNPLLETGTAYVLLTLLKQNNVEDEKAFQNAMLSCENELFFTKKPGLPDDISHDDIIGMVSGGVALGGQARVFVAYHICLYLIKNKGVLSTTGKFYWDALVKPWHAAYYLLSVNWILNLLAKIILPTFLAAAILVDAYTNKDNASDKRLAWLMVKTVKGKSALVDIAISVWTSRLIKVWGSMKNVFKAFHGEDHAFTKYCPE